MVKCQSCGGTYEPVCADGVRYFHACPPLSVPELRAALEGGALPVSKAVQARIAAARALDAKRDPADVSPLAVDTLLATITIERPNKRDENILTPATSDQPAQVRSAGAGVVDVGDVESTGGAPAADV